MSKEEKRLGIAPVPVRRKSQPEESRHKGSRKYKKRWHGRYPHAIHIYVDEIRKSYKQAKEWQREIDRFEDFSSWDTYSVVSSIGSCECALKEGFRRCKEGKPKDRPLLPWERSFFQNIKIYKGKDNSERRKRRLTTFYWKLGWDIANENMLM